MFDFNPLSYGIYMQVEEAFDVNRYINCSAPLWFGVDIQPPDFQSTQHVNSLSAFFHFNSGDCSILPSTKVLNYKRCKMDIDRNLCFLKMSCSSVLEARKRALVLAYLTYDMTRHIFVKLNTGEMLENPFDHQNIYEVQELYNIEESTDPVEIQATITK